MTPRLTAVVCALMLVACARPRLVVGPRWLVEDVERRSQGVRLDPVGGVMWHLDEADVEVHSREGKRLTFEGVKVYGDILGDRVVSFTLVIEVEHGDHFTAYAMMWLGVLVAIGNGYDAPTPLPPNAWAFPNNIALDESGSREWHVGPAEGGFEMTVGYSQDERHPTTYLLLRFTALWDPDSLRAEPD